MIATRRPGDDGGDEQMEVYFERVCRVLHAAVGPDWAMTLDEITTFCKIPTRRTTEKLFELHLSRFPWPLVADGRGYYIPTSAEQLNRYCASLRGRALKDFMRRRTVMQKAVACGWKRDGKAFARPPQQQDLRLG